MPLLDQVGLFVVPDGFDQGRGQGGNFLGTDQTSRALERVRDEFCLFQVIAAHRVGDALGVIAVTAQEQTDDLSVFFLVATNPGQSASDIQGGHLTQAGAQRR